MVFLKHTRILLCIWHSCTAPCYIPHFLYKFKIAIDDFKQLNVTWSFSFLKLKPPDWFVDVAFNISILPLIQIVSGGEFFKGLPGHICCVLVG